jgi:hypothetical protein
MRIERSELFAITSILDRNGKRVGNYLVDRSKDSLNREKREQRGDPEEDEAVVLHSADGDLTAAESSEDELKVAASLSALNITA